MKYTKEFKLKGTVREVTGSVVAEMNITTKLLTGTHAVTHDDYCKSVPVHKVTAYIEGKVYLLEDDLRTEEQVLIASEKLMKRVYQELERLSNKEPEISFNDKMIELFKS